MTYQHKNLAGGRWFKLSFYEQMANIGSEAGRAIKWKNQNNAEYCRLAFERALELLDLTASDEKNKKRLKELKVSAQVFVGENGKTFTNKTLCQ